MGRHKLNTSGGHFTTCCLALTAGLSLTLNLTTNCRIPISQPLSCVSLSCANLSLSLTSQISQWSSLIETTSSGQSVNRKLQVLIVSGFIKFKSKHSKFFTSRPYINPTTLEIHHAGSSRWPNDRAGVDFILAVFNNNVVQILTHDTGCETRLSLFASLTNLTHDKGCETLPSVVNGREDFSYLCNVHWTGTLIFSECETLLIHNFITCTLSLGKISYLKISGYFQCVFFPCRVTRFPLTSVWPQMVVVSKVSTLTRTLPSWPRHCI